MNDYFQYVHNLKGVNQYDRLKSSTRDAIVSVLLRQLEDYNTLEKTILKESDKEVLGYISKHLDLKTYCKSIVLSTDTSSYVDEVDFNNVNAIVNLKRVNFTQHPNKLFRAVNTLLPNGGIYIGRLETYGERKEKIFNHVGRRFGMVFWLIDFVLHRVIPRIPYLDDLYYYLTGGQFHAVSGTEVLGRLTYCGFEIIDFRAINGFSYFVTIKTRNPNEKQNPSYYPIIRLNRVGRHGKMLRIFKFRTMHPYSEFLQEYILRLNGYDDRGKPRNDYRVTRWGRFMRKLWIDELPQLYFVLKGEMKLVGLRPLSQVRFNEFPDDLKAERIKYKPGCFPPYVALNMPDEKANIEAERIYLKEYEKHPIITDFRYFIKSVFNILTNRISGS